MNKQENYNPLEKKHIGESVVKAMLDQAAMPLGSITPFIGAGIYALYYKGSFPAYVEAAKAKKSEKFKHPIYVGKAVPQGARKGVNIQVGQELFKRLRDHSESIKQTSNLDINDFYCRYLNVDDIWIPLGESLLIEIFKPVWNVAIDGFGNHDPGGGRYKGMKSKWDVLHPGRAWAIKCQNRPESEADLIGSIRAYLSRR